MDIIINIIDIIIDTNIVINIIMDIIVVMAKAPCLDFNEQSQTIKKQWLRDHKSIKCPLNWMVASLEPFHSMAMLPWKNWNFDSCKIPTGVAIMLEVKKII